MMMRGSKEQHDELFKQTSLETLPETPQGVSSGTPIKETGDDRGGTTQTRFLRPDLSTLQRMSTKARCRFDSRIGGWRRVY